MWYIVWALFMAYGIYLFVLIWMRQSSAKVVSAEEFGKDLRHGQLIDVREKDEYQAGHIPGADNFPLSELGTTYTNLDKNQSYYVVCQAGGRSARACEFLEAQGFDVINVTSGMNEWQGEVAK